MGKGNWKMSETVAKNIRAQRMACGMTQEELAAKVFTTRQTISNYETGKSKPDYETIGKRAAALGVSGEMLLYDMGDRHKKLKAWCVCGAVVFVFLLMRSVRYSSFIMGRSQAARLVYDQWYVTIAKPALCIIMGWVLVRLYELYIYKDELHIDYPKIMLTALALLLAAWFVWAFAELLEMYAAAADTARNEYGGPAMLSVYLEAFYYRYIYTTLVQLPVLNCVFAFAGGIFAVCLNGKKI